MSVRWLFYGCEDTIAYRQRFEDRSSTDERLWYSKKISEKLLWDDCDILIISLGETTIRI